MRYQPALDGIRGLAVLAVLAYHADLPWAKGGFLGVDAFFVLSGYLITALLLAEWHSSGSIDLVNFWVRRMRRLLPVPDRARSSHRSVARLGGVHPAVAVAARSFGA